MKQQKKLSVFLIPTLLLMMFGMAGPSVVAQGADADMLRIDFKNQSGHDVWFTIVGGLTNGAAPGFWTTNQYLGVSGDALKNAPFLVAKKDQTSSTLYLSKVPSSGRVFMSLDRPAQGFLIVTNTDPKSAAYKAINMAQPTTANPSVTPYENQWQFFEMSRQNETNDHTFFMNISYVDMFHIPYSIQENGTTNMSGVVMSRKDALSKLAPQFAGMWANCLNYNTSAPFTGKICQVANPGALLCSTPSNAIFGAQSGYLLQASNIWAGKLMKTVTVDAVELYRPETNRPSTYPVTGTFTGGKLTFPNHPEWGVGGPESIEVPDFHGIVGCADALQPVNVTVQSLFCRNLSSAMTVGVYPSDGVFSKTWWHSDSTRASLYQKAPYNVYAKAIHTVLYENKGYAFAFDDVCGLDGSFGNVKPGAAADCGVTLTIYDCSDFPVTSGAGLSSKPPSKPTGNPPPKVDW